MTLPIELFKAEGKVKTIRTWNEEIIIVVELNNGETVLAKERHIETLIKPGDKVIGDLTGHILHIDKIKEEIPLNTLKTAFLRMMMAARTEGIEVDQKFYDLESEISSSIDLDITDMKGNLDHLYEVIERATK
ncbi:hypothetical protein QTG56_24220 (plasmid) [Rossellomorea sp. AcN35-11]|nr:hypothetical protein [Rossellomorea aquimaris]WJV31746.1 hypothetical protein QTG56_24220 [Rossellomorea sp. AcN35-11]